MEIKSVLYKTKKDSVCASSWKERHGILRPSNPISECIHSTENSHAGPKELRTRVVTAILCKASWGWKQQGSYSRGIISEMWYVHMTDCN